MDRPANLNLDVPNSPSQEINQPPTYLPPASASQTPKYHLYFDESNPNPLLSQTCPLSPNCPLTPNCPLNSTYHLPSDLFEVDVSPIRHLPQPSDHTECEELRVLNTPPLDIRDISSVQDWLGRIRIEPDLSESLEWDNFTPPVFEQEGLLCEEEIQSLTDPNFLDTVSKIELVETIESSLEDINMSAAESKQSSVLYVFYKEM